MITMRGVGYIIGGLIKLKFLKGLGLHKGMLCGCIGGAITSYLLTTTLNEFIVIGYSFLFAVSLLFIDVYINVCFITIGGGDVKRYINIAFIFNSIGNFIGPTLVSYLGIKIMYILAVSYTIMSIAYGLFKPLKEFKEK